MSTSTRWSKEIREVYTHYRKHHPRSHPKPKPESKATKAIKARLESGYSVDQLKSAIDGMHMTPHNLGENDRGEKYLGLELCMRSDDQVNRFAETAASGIKKPRRKLYSKHLAAMEADQAITEAYNAKVRAFEERERDTGMVFDANEIFDGLVSPGD